MEVIWYWVIIMILSLGLYVDYHDPSDTVNGNDTSGYFSYSAITSSEGAYMLSQRTDVYLTAYISVLE